MKRLLLALLLSGCSTPNETQYGTISHELRHVAENPPSDNFYIHVQKVEDASKPCRNKDSKGCTFFGHTFVEVYWTDYKGGVVLD